MIPAPVDLTKLTRVDALKVEMNALAYSIRSFRREARKSKHNKILLRRDGTDLVLTYRLHFIIYLFLKGKPAYLAIPPKDIDYYTNKQHSHVFERFYRLLKIFAVDKDRIRHYVKIYSNNEKQLEYYRSCGLRTDGDCLRHFIEIPTFFPRLQARFLTWLNSTAKKPEQQVGPVAVDLPKS